MSEPSLFGQERWTATELAEALCLSTQRVNQLVKEGILPIPVDGRYAPRESVSRYVQHIRQREDSKTHAGEAVKKMQLENAMREIRLMKISGELVPLARVQKDLFESTRRVRDGLMNLPSRLSGVFAAESSQQKIFDSFTKEIHSVLSELSSRQFGQIAAESLSFGDEPVAVQEQQEDPQRDEPVVDEPVDQSGDPDRFQTGD